MNNLMGIIQRLLQKWDKRVIQPPMLASQPKEDNVLTEWWRRTIVYDPMLHGLREHELRPLPIAQTDNERSTLDVLLGNKTQARFGINIAMADWLAVLNGHGAKKRNNRRKRLDSHALAYLVQCPSHKIDVLIPASVSTKPPYLREERFLTSDSKR